MSDTATTISNANSPVLVILGSTRAGRICPLLAAWVIGIARACTDLEYEVVDLLDWHLPVDDEPGIPALGGYAQEHTRAWSRKVASAVAIVFVTPQYNWGYPAPLKNAIDHLYREWADKPLVIVTYGGHGGNKCAAQLRQVAEGIHMRAVKTMPAIELTDEMIMGATVEPQRDFAIYADTVREAFAELAVELKSPAVASQTRPGNTHAP
jgi:NAD(P)H-dependent FMN reductase